MSGPTDAGPIVIDAPVLIKLVVPEELADRAHALVDGALRAGRPVHTPPGALAEIAEVLFDHVRRKRLTVAEADAALSILQDLPVVRGAPAGYWQAAIGFARDTEQKRLQPVRAIVLANMLGGVVWTGHRETYETFSKRVPWLRWIGDAET